MNTSVVIKDDQIQKVVTLCGRPDSDYGYHFVKWYDNGDGLGDKILEAFAK